MRQNFVSQGVLIMPGSRCDKNRKNHCHDVGHIFFALLKSDLGVEQTGCG